MNHSNVNNGNAENHIRTVNENSNTSSRHRTMSDNLAGILRQRRQQQQQQLQQSPGWVPPQQTETQTHRPDQEDDYEIRASSAADVEDDVDGGDDNDDGDDAITGLESTSMSSTSSSSSSSTPLIADVTFTTTNAKICNTGNVNVKHKDNNDTNKDDDNDDDDDDDLPLWERRIRRMTDDEMRGAVRYVVGAFQQAQEDGRTKDRKIEAMGGLLQRCGKYVHLLEENRRLRKENSTLKDERLWIVRERLELKEEQIGLLQENRALMIQAMVRKDRELEVLRERVRTLERQPSKNENDDP